MIAALRVLFVLCTLSSCRGAVTRSDADAGGCTRAGESCLYEPGKLGLCVEIEREAGPPSLLCQSQH